MNMIRTVKALGQIMIQSVRLAGGIPVIALQNRYFWENINRRQKKKKKKKKKKKNNKLQLNKKQ